MQGLARFSLVAVIVLAAILLGSWGYLTARYGSVEEFMASEDSPYWRPGSPSEAHDELEADENGSAGSLAERVAGEVKAGTSHPEESGDWRRVKPEKEGAPSPAPGVETPLALEARIDTEYGDLAIETEEGAVDLSQRTGPLKPFVARTVPKSAVQRSAYTEPNAYEILTKSGGTRSAALQALDEAGILLIHGKVVDEQKRKGVESIVVALADAKTAEPTPLRAVTNSAGEFLLYVPKELAAQCRCTEKAAWLAVIGDGWVPAERKYNRLVIQSSRVDSNGAHEIHVERSRGLRVRVRISNPRPAEDCVRLWCELRDEDKGPCFDDNIFMSLDVPKSGEVVFRLPRCHYGKVRVGACGNGWASDVFETEKIAKDVVSTSLKLNAAHTRYVRGFACESRSVDGSGRGGVHAARMLAPFGGDLTYTDETGAFEFSMCLSGTAVPVLRVSTISGFLRSFSLVPLNRSEEEHSLIRAVYEAAGVEPKWQILIPTRVETTVNLHEPVSVDESDAGYLYWRWEAPEISGQDRIRIANERTRVGDLGATEFNVPSLAWGSTNLILECLNRKSKSSRNDFLTLARYRVDSVQWEEAEVTVTDATAGSSCIVRIKLNATTD